MEVTLIVVVAVMLAVVAGEGRSNNSAGNRKTAGSNSNAGSK